MHDEHVGHLPSVGLASLLIGGKRVAACLHAHFPKCRRRRVQAAWSGDIGEEPVTLRGLAESSFANVLCETVIMHLEPEAITPAVERLLAILVLGGILYLSWRVTEGADRRDEHGRLCAAFEPERVLRALTATQVLLDEQVGSVSSGKLIRRIVARKQSAEN
jgi:hypothetical protein